MTTEARWPASSLLTASVVLDQVRDKVMQRFASYIGKTV
jgi:hypothetical protein